MEIVEERISTMVFERNAVKDVMGEIWRRKRTWRVERDFYASS